MGTKDAVHSALSTEYVQTLLKIKAKQLARRPEFRRTDPADIEHDLICHVLKQADNYDPNRSAPNTFITRVVETAAAMLVRDRGRIKRAAGYRAISLERTYLYGDQRQTTLGDIVSEGDLRRRCGGQIRDDRQKAELSADIARAMEGLTPRQREIAKRLAWATEASVAREMGISRRQVRNDVLAIREHLVKLGLTGI